MSEANEQVLTMQELREAVEQSLTPLHELKGIKREQLEAVYALAHDYYRTGNYEKAETLFRFLTLFDHFSEKYWMAYGAVEQVLKKWDAAIAAYGMVCMTFDVHNVKAAFYAAQCHLGRGDRENALSALEHVKTFAEPETETGREFLAKAETLRAQILANGAKQEG